MPVHKTITINSNTNVLIWKIEESFDELSENITLNKRSINRLNSMKSDLHRKGFLSVRQLLKKSRLY